MGTGQPRPVAVRGLCNDGEMDVEQPGGSKITVPQGRETTVPQGRKITVLAGGIGAARFLRGLLAALRSDDPTDDLTEDPTDAPATVTVIGNTGDDISLFGLRVCPDLDTVMYTLGGGVDEAQGWGRVGESFAVKEELTAYGAGPQWFGLGDKDIATHLLRTQWLADGVPLSEVTRRLCERWQPGVRLLPMSDDRIETHVLLDDAAGSQRSVHFQEWWVRLHAKVPAAKIVAVGAAAAAPAPGVVEAIADADVVLFPPSNPVVSIGTILQVPGIREAVSTTAAPVVGVSPIIGGAPVRGMADACLDVIGVETSAAAVGALYGPDLIDGWLVDDADAGTVVEGVAVRSRPLFMTDVEATAAIARAALSLAEELRSSKRPVS
jgi:LPPG:FO 2-phospho-L-lactate transferase